MADFSLKAAPVLGGLDLNIGQCKLVERTDIALISAAVPLDGRTALEARLKTEWNLDTPSPATSTHAGPMRAIPMTADQMMLAFEPGPTLTEASVHAALDSDAYTTTQTDAWVILELSGAGATTALERICPVELDAEAFPVNGAARTTIEHLGVLIVRLGTDCFLLLSARSSAQSFLHAVEISCDWTAP